MMSEDFEDYVKAAEYLDQHTYFWSSIIIVPEAFRFDYRKLVATLPASLGINVTINEKQQLVFTIELHKSTRDFHPDKHLEIVSNALQTITHAMINAYIGPLEVE